MKIVEMLAEEGHFETLLKAIKIAELVEELSGSDLITLLAPNNAAFEKIPESILNDIMTDPERLSKIIRLHMIDGKFTLEDIRGEQVLLTREGQELNVEDEDHEVMIENAEIVRSDIECANGIIHEINRVILPIENGEYEELEKEETESEELQ